MRASLFLRHVLRKKCCTKLVYLHACDIGMGALKNDNDAVYRISFSRLGRVRAVGEGGENNANN